VPGHDVSDHRLQLVTIELTDIFEEAFEDVLALQKQDSPAIPGQSSKRTRGNAIIKKLQSCQNPWALLDRLSPCDQKAAIVKLVVIVPRFSS
jgi:hypothetical protein